MDAPPLSDVYLETVDETPNQDEKPNEIRCARLADLGTSLTMPDKWPKMLYLQDFDSMEHFKEELIDYLDYYNNRRIKLKLKGLTPAQHRYQTLQVA